MDALFSKSGRYDRRLETNGTWTVFDAFTGHPAEVGSRQTTGMQIADAEEMMRILNSVHPANDCGTMH